MCTEIIRTARFTFIIPHGTPFATTLYMIMICKFLYISASLYYFASSN